MKWIVLLEVILVSSYLRELNKHFELFQLLCNHVLVLVMMSKEINVFFFLFFSCIRFLRSIGVAYAAADLVISRAGAMTCSEIMALGKPSILVC